jgi:hypothetical protein
VTATLENVRPTPVEQDIRQKLQEQIDAFTMPKPHIGQTVVWYPSAERSGRSEVAFVVKASHRNVVLRMASGLPRETVCHVDDPKLKTSADIRESGAWDFTDERKQQLASDAKVVALAAAVEALQAKVKTLEELMK